MKRMEPPRQARGYHRLALARRPPFSQTSVVQEASPATPRADDIGGRLDIPATEPLRAATSVVFLCVALLVPGVAFGLLASGRIIGLVLGLFWAPFGLALGAFVFATARSAAAPPGGRRMAVATLVAGVVHFVLICGAGALLFWDLANTSW